MLLCFCCWYGTRVLSNGRFYSIGESASAGRWRNPSCQLGKPERWSRAGGRLKPDLKVTIGGDRPPRLGGDVVTFDDTRECFIDYSEYEQQIRVADEGGGDRVLAKRRDLVDSAKQMMAADPGTAKYRLKSDSYGKRTCCACGIYAE